jgi:putative membrane protein
MMLWVKAFHIIFMVTWFAGLFYLPRLFVYHAMGGDAESTQRFQLMERKLFGIMTIGAVFTVVFGAWLWLGYGFSGGWLDAKLALVALLIVYHAYLGKIMRDFRENKERHGHKFFRWLNEIPAVILIAIVILVVVKPF